MRRAQVLVPLGLLVFGGLIWQGKLWWKKQVVMEISRASKWDSRVQARLDELQQGEYEMLLYRKVVNLMGERNSSQNESPWEAYLRMRGDREKNDLSKLLWLQLTASVEGNAGNHTKACEMAQKALVLAATQDSAPVIDIHNCIALNRYFMGQPDSAVAHWKLAYRRAKNENNLYSLLVIANNLGTYYHNTGMMEMAKKYFMVADEMSVKEKQRNPVVVNNIVSILMAEKQTAEANRYWKENASLLQGTMQTYYGQLFKINEALLDQASGRWGKARDMLKSMPRDSIEPQLISEYLRLAIAQKDYEKRFLQADDEAFFRAQCLSHLGDACVHLRSFLIQHIQTQQDVALRDSIYAFYINPSHAGEHHALSAAAEIMLAVGVAGLPVLEGTLKLSAVEHALQHLELQNALRKSEDLEILEFERLSYLLSQQQKDLGALQIRQRVLLGGLFLAVLVVGLIGIVYRKNVKIAAMSSEKSRMEIQGLENEIALNGRLVEYSKLVIDKEKDFQLKLEDIRKGLPVEYQGSVKALMRELENTSRINLQENPFVAESLMQQQGQLEDKYPGFAQLNATEKRILVLTEHLYTSKDIAQMLGCSPQYVRNVRSRIRKKISE